jgi:hypothetical protein
LGVFGQAAWRRVEPGAQCPLGQVAEPRVVPVDGEPPVGNVQVIESEVADRPVRAACSAAKATASRCAGFCASCSADLMASGLERYVPWRTNRAPGFRSRDRRVTITAARRKGHPATDTPGAAD